MSLASELARLRSAKSGIAAAIEDKGVEVPEGTRLHQFPALIGQISGGTEVHPAVLGRDWEVAESAGTVGTLSQIIFENGLFIGLERDGPGICVSEDGVLWTRTVLDGPAEDPGFRWHAVTWGNSRYVAVGDGWSAVSTDGAAWTAAAMPADTAYHMIAYMDKYRALGENGLAAYSSNGTTWGADRLPDEQIYRFAFKIRATLNYIHYYTVSDSGSIIFYGRVGASTTMAWQASSSLAPFEGEALRGVCSYQDGSYLHYVMVFETGGAFRCADLRVNTSITSNSFGWTALGLLPAAAPAGLSQGDVHLLACNGNGAAMGFAGLAYSTDGGESWQACAPPFQAGGSGLCWDGNGEQILTVTGSGAWVSYQAEVARPGLGMTRSYVYALPEGGQARGRGPTIRQLVLNDGSIKPTGSYASSTYYNTSYGVKIGYMSSGDILLSMKGGTTTAYEYLQFRLASAPDGVSLSAASCSSDSSAAGKPGMNYACVLSGITAPCRISIAMNEYDATYDYTVCAITVTPVEEE